MNNGVVVSINVSNGAVPKRPRSSAYISADGVEGDRQRNRVFHGGPNRAVCIYSYELIQALQAEGHPIEPGAIGENLTIAGIDWKLVRPGAVIGIGDVRLEVTTPAAPCKNIASAFLDDELTRVSEKRHAGWSRWYCRVLNDGNVAVGDAVALSCRPTDAPPNAHY